MSDEPLKYMPRRAKLLSELRGALVPERLGYQTTDGVPTHLILGGRAVSDATNRDFRRMLQNGLVEAADGRVRVTGWGHDHHDSWEYQYSARDFDKQREVDLYR